MANCFLVNINELSKKETIESEGKIKGLITDLTININNKGVNKFSVNSFHRFIIFTNNEEPVNTTKDDRRKWIVRCSDELIGNKEYFKTFYKYLDNYNVIKTCYEYFKSIPDVENFDKLEMPNTEYQQELQEYSVCQIENWLRDFTYDNQNREDIELKAESILEKFNEWKVENGVEYNCNSLKFMVRMARLNIPGIGKRKTSGKMMTKFNIVEMKKYFKIGCLL
jgi:sporulation protein YlmC with PRC-barrel domain